MPDDRFLLRDFEPAYMVLERSGRLRERVVGAQAELAECRSCPRDCGADRLRGEQGHCRTGRYAVVSSAFPHHGEEDCLRGTRGSGTIFFSYCNLRCVFCQNADISHGGVGRECSPEEIADVMLGLQDAGCHNINWVTPTHVVSQAIEALALAVERGLRLPVVYNTSAYDTLETLRLLEGVVDIYMPDFKFWRAESSSSLSKARDYPERAREAIREMHRQVGDLVMGTDGVARRGLLVRHLVMPGLSEETASFFGWLARNVSRDTFVNVMGQYRPAHRVGTRDPAGGVRHEEVNRRPTRAELAAAYRAAKDAGLWRFDGP